MSEDTGRTHPDETTLIGWLDEPASVDVDVEAHLEACPACAGTVRDLRAVLADLAGEPSMPDPDALATNRRRIAAAIAAPDEPAVGSFSAWRPVAWTTVLAAAALAAMLLWSPRGGEPPASTSEVVAGAPIHGGGEGSLAEAAERAAEAVVAAALPTSGPAGDLGTPVLDEDATGSLAEIETTTPSLVDESTYESIELAERFAALSEEDQAAILAELSDLTIEL